MPFDSKIDNITAESQHIVDEFLGYYTFPNSYGGMIKKIQKKLNITVFKKLTYGNYIEIMSQYQQGISFTDKIIFERTNYCKEVSAYKQHKKFYNEQAEYVIEFCKKRNILYHIKEKTMTPDK